MVLVCDKRCPLGEAKDLDRPLRREWRIWLLMYIHVYVCDSVYDAWAESESQQGQTCCLS